MARQEHDREDLLAEAKALVERAAIRVHGQDHETVVGFRPDGSVSFYLSPARVYHFTSDGRLRRAFVDDLLYKAERGRLVALRRQRTDKEVALVRDELDDTRQAAFLATMQFELQTLCQAIESGQFRLLGQVPDGTGVLHGISRWIARHAVQMAVAQSPRAG